MKAETLASPFKGQKIAYWIVTGFISLVLLNGGIQDAFKQPPYITWLRNMGYPDYFAIVIGVWKVLGVIALLIPGFLLVKEWAYAGFVFLLSGAIISHSVISEIPIFQGIMLILIVLSWYLRPSSRRIQSPGSQQH
ncbi:MAG: DoxX family protein [Flavobacterium sp.]|uniref:DoxX family protein n=1 Tax=Flavobacterium sp. TaxID=239 RepID=UPI003265644F